MNPDLSGIPQEHSSYEEDNSYALWMDGENAEWEAQQRAAEEARLGPPWSPSDPQVWWQWGCSGLHRGIGTDDCPRRSHHHCDDHCPPPPIVVLVLIMAGLAR